MSTCKKISKVYGELIADARSFKKNDIRRGPRAELLRLKEKLTGMINDMKSMDFQLGDQGRYRRFTIDDDQRRKLTDLVLDNEVNVDMVALGQAVQQEANEPWPAPIEQPKKKTIILFHSMRGQNFSSLATIMKVYNLRFATLRELLNFNDQYKHELDNKMAVIIDNDTLRKHPTYGVGRYFMGTNEQGRWLEFERSGEQTFSYSSIMRFLFVKNN